MKREMVSILGGIAAAACLLLAAPAGAATLIGDYQFQGTRASSGPGPDLAAVNDFGTFQTENVMGTSRQVDVFIQGAGFRMEPTGLSAGNAPQTVVMTFRLLDGTGFNRILDWSHGTSDNGIYDLARKVYYSRPFPQAVESSAAVFGSNTYSTVVVTSADPGITRVFVNGAPVLQSNFREGFIGNAFTFFVDGSGGVTGEESAGAVSCIRAYEGVLTDAEIAAIGASPDCIAHPVQPTQTNPPVTKKCKKHKRKHRSAKSAKKKCKKHKKKR